MKKEKIYPKGVMAFSASSKAPEFVIGTIIINPNKLIDWLNENQNLMQNYKDEQQLKLQLLKNDKGLYMVVDTYQKAPF